MSLSSLPSTSVSFKLFLLSELVFFAVPDATLGFGAALVAAALGALAAALALGAATDAF